MSSPSPSPSPSPTSPTSPTSASSPPSPTPPTTPADDAASANPRAWHHAIIGGVAVFLVVGVGSALVLRSAVFGFAALGAFAGTAVAAVVAERAPTRWPWYAYLVIPLAAVVVIQTLLVTAG